MVETSTFVQLRRGNDWGVEYIAVEPLRNGMASAKNAIRVENGQGVEVQWPDGSVTQERISLRSFANQVGDMGRTYGVDFKIPGIDVSVRGIVTWIPLDAPGLRVHIAEPHANAP